MRGGSIPVFGASMFTNAWFGRLVQWNGMAVARSLHGLARAGGGDEWAQVAEDLTVSGQRQQIADPDNPDYGRYPDYWNMRTGIPGYWLSPGLLLTVTLERSGYTPDGDWRVLRSGGKLISIGSPTPLRSPRAGEQPLGRVVTDVEVPFDLSFTVDYPLGPTSCVAIVGIAEPQQVTVRGRELNRSDGPAEGESWQYVEDFAAVVLSLRHADASPVPVVVRSLEPADPPNVLDRREWDFSQGLFGWGAAPNAVRVEHRDGRLVAEALGGDPYFSGPRLALPSEEIERISIRARGTAAGTFQVFWANDDGGYAPERSTTTSALPADGEFHIVTADVSGRAQWKGMLRSLRLDPPGGEGSATEIDWIQLGPWLP